MSKLQPLQFLRKLIGTSGPPTILAPGQPAMDELAEILWLGFGDNGSNQATSIVPIGGRGLFILKSLLGIANGVATLGTDGKLNAIQIPNALVGANVYQGVWNATTNTPALASGAGTKGQQFRVSVAGSTALDGIVNWNVGDYAVFNGSTWDKWDGPAEAVTTVANRIGAVVLSSADLTDAKAAGIALLQAATVGAQRAALGVDMLRVVPDASYPLVLGDFNVQFAAITAARTATLLSAASYNPGQRVRIGDRAGSVTATNTITVAAAGQDKINGATTQVISNPFGQLDLMSDGVSAWTMMGVPATTNTYSNTDDGTF